LLNDLQTLARAEAGALDLYREPTDLPILLTDIVNAYQQRASDAGVDLHMRPAVAMPELELDPMRMRQVVENLVTNALRHTPSGGTIEVSVTRESDTAHLVIRDTGSGIAPDLIPHIFDRFVKSADSGGSGLGLAIARRLIEAQGGTIRAKSDPGQGTEMHIELPIEPGSAADR
jgi:signal transduction histidine kinase